MTHLTKRRADDVVNYADGIAADVAVCQIFRAMQSIRTERRL